MARVTKTINPLHFEDLEPHRFEDLVRQLSYDFKDWQDIEGTGRAGSDDGFDIRAWEKTGEITNQSEDDDKEEGAHPMDGNLWMIQCKREKELGPKRVAEIINETIKDKPPYGYVLAAPVNFSKASYDTFREELVKKGVMEFHLWGKAELEDKLYMPKNDRILFTFFGISLVVQKRTKIRDVKFALNNKNKLMRIFGDRNMRESILIRDIDAEHYPFKNQYEDFKKKPRWSERITVGYHPLGLLFDLRRYYAYIDTEKKEFDFFKAVDLTNRHKDREDSEEYHALSGDVKDFWEHLPKKNQGTFVFEGLLHFEDMLIIDEKGDVVYDFPHIFVDDRAFKWTWEKIELGNSEINLHNEEYKRVKCFPAKFPKSKKGKIHEDKIIDLHSHEISMYREGLESTELFDVDDKYSDVEVRDSLPLKKDPTEQSSSRQLLEVTYKYETTVKEIIEKFSHLKAQIEKQAGRAVKENEKLTVFEVKQTYDWEPRA